MTRFNYMLLSRLISDCDYFLGYGNANEKDLWAGSVEKQIAKMRELYDLIPEKPEWISLEDIADYEECMLTLRLLHSLKYSGVMV